MLVLIVVVAVVVFALGGAGAQGWGASSDDCGYEGFSGEEQSDYDGSYERDGDKYDNSRGGLFERFQDGTCSKADMELLMESMASRKRSTARTSVPWSCAVKMTFIQLYFRLSPQEFLATRFMTPGLKQFTLAKILSIKIKIIIWTLSLPFQRKKN